MKEYIDLIIAICGAISVIVPLAIKYYNAIKALIKEKNYVKILDIMRGAATEAEKLYESGAERREYVLNIIKVSCDNLKVDYDEKRFDEELTKLIDATKEINK